MRLGPRERYGDAANRSGRSEAWLKVKCAHVQRFPVIGFVPAKGNSLAALRLSRRESKALVYAGKVGSGFSVRTAQSVRERLAPLIRKSPPVAKPLRKKDTIWVEPMFEAEVEFRGMTSDGMLRHPSFKGLKE